MNLYTLPPGPRQPALLQGLSWVRRPLPWLRGLRAAHGPTFTVRFPPGPCVFTADPEVVEALVSAPEDALDAGRSNFIALPFLGPEALVLQDGEAHHRLRRRVLPALTGQALRPERAALVEDAARLASAPFAGALRPALRDLLLRSILRLTFGAVPPDDPEGLAESVHATLDAAKPSIIFVDALRVDLGPWSPWGRYLRRRAALDARFDRELARRRDGPPRPDVLGLLLHGDEPLTDDAIRAQLRTLLFVGHETTTVALAWTFAELLAHPDALARATAEARATDDPEACPFLEAVCHEALRLHPPLPVLMRQARRPTRLGPWWEVPTDAWASAALCLLHREPSLYPDPDRFLPERMLGGAPPRDRYLPFGAGQRACLGMRLAFLQMRIVTWALLRHADVERRGGRVRTRRRTVTLAPAGLRVAWRPRRA